MAIAFDSAGKDGVGGTGTSKTWSFTNTAGDFLVIDTWSNGGDPGAITMTYGGVSMTQIGTNQTGGASPSYQAIFYLASPATGANDVVTTYTNSSSSGFFSHALTYSGTNTSSPVANATQQVTGNVGNDSIAVTITTTASSWAVWFMGGDAGRSYTAGANTTLRSGASDAQAWAFDSGGVANSSPWTLNATIAAGTEVKLDTAFELKAPSGGGGISRDARALTLLGIG